MWIPKYRHKVFVEPYRSTMKGIIQKVGYDYDIDIVELEIPNDHIHMVIRGIPKQSPSDVMQIVKSITLVNFLGFILKSKRNIFGVVSCGHKSFLSKRNATEEVIRKYVQDQLIELDRKEINSDQLVDLF
jgi:putative transposase